MLDYWQNEYVALKMRMFHDVVYNQFRHLNGPPPEKYADSTLPIVQAANRSSMTQEARD